MLEIYEVVAAYALGGHEATRAFLPSLREVLRRTAARLSPRITD